MNELLDLSLVNWSRAQFALTAMYHWLFVPLTLGITFILAIMETIYVKTGNPQWKKITQFWMKIFGINFAIGVATGIILEFEFGTNWSNYSWFVGDIFGAPLAIEGIMAFFMESTFIAVMFFGWGKVSKGFHLASTWLTALGANLSALWILVANGWMQYPVGMQFNPDTARNEMVNFWHVFLSPVATSKFLHTIFSGFELAAIFVIGISAWYLLKKREIVFARKSILVSAVFGLISSVFVIGFGHASSQQVAYHQPMKLAAMEGLYQGQEGAGLVAMGVLSTHESDPQYPKLKKFLFRVEIPKGLSLLAYLNTTQFIPGIKDLMNGNKERNILSAKEKIARGKEAIQVLKDYKVAKDNGNAEEAAALRTKFMSDDFQKNYFKYFGYGYIKNPSDLIPDIPMVFYSFRIMVMLGTYFVFFFLFALLWLTRGTLEKKRWFLRLALITMPLAYLASMSGWILAEVGRQPWVIQDLLPTMAAVSQIGVSAVQVTFWLFAFIFTLLLIAEVKIMTKQVKIGPKDGGH